MPPPPPLSTSWSRVGHALLTPEVKALKKKVLALTKALAQLKKQVAALKAKSARKPPARRARGIKGPAGSN